MGWSGDRDTYFQTLKDYKNNKNTLRSYLSAVERNPDDIEANYDVAQKYIFRYEMVNARPYFEKIVQLDPENKSGHALEARCYIAISQARSDGDASPLESFIEACEDSTLLELAYNNLIGHYRRQENPKAMLAAYEDAIAHFPQNSDWMNGCAWLIYEEKMTDHYAKGIELAEKAVQINPDEPNIWDTLAWLYYEDGQYEKATDAMKRAIELAPDIQAFKDNLEKMKQKPAA